MPKAKPAIAADARARFLDMLAETANVSASAKHAEVSTFDVYQLRKTSKTFCDQWARALGEGYVRLEADLLAEALKPIANATADKTIKQKAEKTRIAMFLITAHRAAVRGEARVQAAPSAATKRPTPAALRDAFTRQFATMRERMTAAPATGDDTPAAA
jgi:hypothetical protein